MQKFRSRGSGQSRKIYPITPRMYNKKMLGGTMNFSLDNVQRAQFNAQTATKMFNEKSYSRKERLAIKRAVVSAGNKAEVAGNHDVALIYRKAHQAMLLPSKDGLVYRYDASGKRDKVDYGYMGLTKLKEERDYAQKRGWTGEVAKIDKELAKRAKDRAAHTEKSKVTSSIKDESSDADKYEKMALQAKAEGRTEDAKVLCSISKDEARHEKLLKKIENKDYGWEVTVYPKYGNTRPTHHFRTKTEAEAFKTKTEKQGDGAFMCKSKPLRDY